MLLLDVNVLLAAQRADHPEHASLRRWFDDLLASGEPFGVPLGVWASFLRLTTNRRIFPVATSLGEAFAFIEAVEAQPQHLALVPGPRHLVLLRRACEEAGADGDLVPDAVLAALAVEHRCTVASLDRDFARFGSIRHVVPPTT